MFGKEFATATMRPAARSAYAALKSTYSRIVGALGKVAA